MAPGLQERFSIELELLQSIYPEQVQYAEKGRELSYNSANGSLKLRLLDDYLEDSLPEVISASAGRQDIRDRIARRIQQCEVGEEVLDAIINDFIDICDQTRTLEHAESQESDPEAAATTLPSSTIIIWLHHLLNTNKRKLALHPPGTVSGITKPGYPGVLIYAGPSQDVQEHVNELKAQNWQAFQPRLESDEEWTFQHGKGVIEVETMKDVVADVGEEKKAVFMEAMRMK